MDWRGYIFLLDLENRRLSIIYKSRAHLISDVSRLIWCGVKARVQIDIWGSKYLSQSMLRWNVKKRCIYEFMTMDPFYFTTVVSVFFLHEIRKKKRFDLFCTSQHNPSTKRIRVFKPPYEISLGFLITTRRSAYIESVYDRFRSQFLCYQMQQSHTKKQYQYKTKSDRHEYGA